MNEYGWEFTLDRLAEIRADHHAAMLGKQETERLVDHYLADYKRGITCSHCSCDMSKQKIHERCSNGGLCVSIEEFDERTERDRKMAITELCTGIDCLCAVIGLTPIAGNKETLQEAMDFARAIQKKHQTCNSDNIQAASVRLMRELAKPNNGL